MASISLPSSIDKIDDRTFRDCYNLRSVSISSSVSTIGQHAFEGTAISSLSFISSHLKKIGNYAFAYCQNLSSVKIPGSVNNIGEGVFEYCENISAISVDGENPIYDSRNNCNAIIETSTNKLIAGCRNSIIPNDVECIASHSLSYFTNLEKLYIPKSVTTIEDNAFIGNSGLVSIHIDAIEPPLVSLSSFDEENYRKTTLYVPHESYEHYYTHSIWGKFEKIEESANTASISVDTIDSGDDTFYSIYGYMLENLSRGINIIRMKDGTTKKVLVK